MPLLDDIGWERHLRPFLYKKLPAATGWSATLGSLAVLLFGVMGVSGAFLAMYYCPSPDKAYQSIDYIMRDVRMGSVLRGIHHWGAGAMVLIVSVHLLANLFSGAFRAPRQITWVAGVFLFLVTLGLGFTGYLLPWDMKAYWATVVATNVPRDVPVVGELLTRILRGGPGVSGLTLTRFYALHMLLLPAMLVLFVTAHLYLVRLHGLAGEAEERPPGSREAVYRFYPEHAFRSALVFALVFAGIVGLAVFATVPREEIAGTLSDSYLPRPEWYFMWLFQLLTYFSGRWESVGSVLIPTAGIAVLFAVPFLARNRQGGVGQRPLVMGAGVACILGIVYLSLTGFAGARPYGQVIPVPDRELTPAELRGLRIFVDRECAYCHQIDGKAGRRVGPDLANMAAKGRSREALVRYVKNPQGTTSGSIMPRYDLPDRDLQALADFMLALDFREQPIRIVQRSQVLEGVAPADPQRAPKPEE